MKILLFLLCYYIATVQFSVTGNTSTIGTAAVLDQRGNSLLVNTNYHIIPAFSHSDGRGGLALMSRNGTCPFDVAQEALRLSNGLPLRFFPSNFKSKVVRLSSDVNIVFMAATICVQPTGWKVGTPDGITGRKYLTSGSVPGRPGAKTVENWFKIKKHVLGSENGHYYKIVYCPSVCRFCKVACGDVGVFYEQGKIWLGLSDEPLFVMFKKALF